MIKCEDLDIDYYKLLGVDAEAHPSIIRPAHKVMMLELGSHPDRGGSTEGAICLNRAREILLDPALRSEYDRLWAPRRQLPPNPPAAPDPRGGGERPSPDTAHSTIPLAGVHPAPAGPLRKPNGRPYIIMCVWGNPTPNSSIPTVRVKLAHEHCRLKGSSPLMLSIWPRPWKQRLNIAVPVTIDSYDVQGNRHGTDQSGLPA